MNDGLMKLIKTRLSACGCLELKFINQTAVSLISDFNPLALIGLMIIAATEWNQLIAVN